MLSDLLDKEYRERRYQNLTVVRLFGITLGNLRTLMPSVLLVFDDSPESENPAYEKTLVTCGNRGEHRVDPWLCRLSLQSGSRNRLGQPVTQARWMMSGLTGLHSLSLDSGPDRIWAHWTGFVTSNIEMQGDLHGGTHGTP